jgi:hypothetical protein
MLEVREKIDANPVPFLYLPKVEFGLHAQPNFGRRGSKGGGKTLGHLRRNSGFAIEHPGKSDTANSEMNGRRRNGHLAEKLPDHFAGMGRIVHHHDVFSFQ